MLVMREITATIISAAAFRPFGKVLSTAPDRVAPWKGRAAAEAVVEMSTAPCPADQTRYVLGVMERHPYSSQTFFPLTPAPYLVVVAPDAPDGEPDLERLSAFVVPGSTVVQYQPAVWHAPLMALGADAQFAMHVHKDGSADDCQLMAIPPAGIRLEVLKDHPGPTPSFGETTHFPEPLSKGDTVDAYE